jgi:hypothetical protein
VKAQIWSFDFAVSFVVFFMVLIPMLFLWNYVNTQQLNQRIVDDVEIKALAASDALVRTAGIPQDWNGTTVRSLGLADEENVLNSTKVGYLLSMDYATLKGMLTGGYDFNLTFSDLNGTAYGGIGTSPANRTSVPVVRYAKYNERIVSVVLMLYS